jgi:hypothetical protein
MPPNVLIEMDDLGADAKIQALGKPRKLSATDAAELVARTISATDHLRYTWEYPRRVLGTSGLEASELAEVCQRVLVILDKHLLILSLVRRSARAVAAREGIPIERLDDLDAAEARVRAAARDVESVLAFARPPRGEGIDWARVKEAKAMFQRGEFVRLNPDARAGEPADS